MSIELETLDQLLGGPMSASLIRSLYGTQEHFVRALSAMLNARELKLSANGEEVPRHRWQTVLGLCDDELRSRRIEFEITEIGARRIA